MPSRAANLALWALLTFAILAMLCNGLCLPDGSYRPWNADAEEGR